MKEFGLVIAVVLSAIGLVGCKEKSTKDVRYWYEHNEERMKLLAECRNNPGERGITPNCINAREAQKKRSLGLVPD